MAVVPDRPVTCRVLHVSQTIIDHSWRYRLTSGHWRLYRNRHSGAWIDTSQARVSLLPDHCHLIPPWSDCQGGCQGQVDHQFVHFQAEVLDGDWPQTCFGPVCTLAQTPVVDALLAQVLVLGQQPAAHLLAQAAAAAALGLAIASLSEDRLQVLVDRLSFADPLAPALRRIGARPHEDLHVSTLAGLCAMSPDHFTRVFRQHLGTTPQRYVQQRRIAWAAEALVDTDRSIDAIAEAAGFANRHHFSRVFHRHTGLPPAAYRHRGRV